MSHQDECNCPFCSLHCPNCGSTEIDVTFKPTFHLRNDTRNELRIEFHEWEMRVECEDCGEMFEHDDFEENWDLEGIADGMSGALGFSDLNEASIDSDGNITREHSTFVSEHCESIKAA